MWLIQNFSDTRRRLQFRQTDRAFMDDRAVVLMIRGRFVVDLRWKTGVDWKRSQFRQTGRALIDGGWVVFMICGRFVVAF